MNINEVSGIRGQGIDPNNFNRSEFTQFPTWLAETKSVIGCPLDCQYCFSQLDGLTPIKPRINISPEDTINLISNSYTYHPEMPLHFGSQTDVFSTRDTISFYTELLQRYGDSKLENPLIFITKREIPDDFINKVKQIRQKVVFYISYSGLSGSEIEPNVRTEDLKNNFIKLKESNLPRVHYWRPFLPENSKKEKIEEILSFVNKYSKCSVVNGLRLNNGIRDHLIKFWPELLDCNYDFSKTGEFWPEGVRNYIKNYCSDKYPNYPLFMGNTQCSLAYVLEVSDLSGMYNNRMCLESLCPSSQRESCDNSFRIPTEDELNNALDKMEIDHKSVRIENNKLLIQGKIETGKRIYLKSVLKFPVLVENVLYENGYNWVSGVDNNPIISIPWKENWIK